MFQHNKYLVDVMIFLEVGNAPLKSYIDFPSYYKVDHMVPEILYSKRNSLWFHKPNQKINVYSYKYIYLSDYINVL